MRLSTGHWLLRISSRLAAGCAPLARTRRGWRHGRRSARSCKRCTATCWISRCGLPWRERRVAASPRLAAAAALLDVGRLGGWAVHGGLPATLVASDLPEFVHEARFAHVVSTLEKWHPLEVGADQSKHLIELLSLCLGAPLATPDLVAQGYTLAGGRRHVCQRSTPSVCALSAAGNTEGRRCWRT